MTEIKNDAIETFIKEAGSNNPGKIKLASLIQHFNRKFIRYLNEHHNTGLVIPIANLDRIKKIVINNVYYYSNIEPFTEFNIQHTKELLYVLFQELSTSYYKDKESYPFLINLFNKFYKPSKNEPGNYSDNVRSKKQEEADLRSRRAAEQREKEIKEQAREKLNKEPATNFSNSSKHEPNNYSENVKSKKQEEADLRSRRAAEQRSKEIEEQAREKLNKEPATNFSTPSKNTNTNKIDCPSNNIDPPTHCLKPIDYKKQILIFHPDKNSGCKEDATKKFQKLTRCSSAGKKTKKKTRSKKRRSKKNKTRRRSKK